MEILTPRRRRFLDAYRSGGYQSASAAVVAAGFKAKNPAVTGSKLLARPEVRAELEHMQAEDRANSSLSLEQLRADLLNLRQRAIERNDLQAELKATELLGKTIGAFTDRLETVQTVSMSDAEAAGKLSTLLASALAQFGLPEERVRVAIVATLLGKPTPPEGMPAKVAPSLH